MRRAGQIAGAVAGIVLLATALALYRAPLMGLMLSPLAFCG